MDSIQDWSWNMAAAQREAEPDLNSVNSACNSERLPLAVAMLRERDSQDENRTEPMDHL